MPQFRQGSVGQKLIGQITPVTGARAGTVNDAGGLATDIDAHGFKSATLIVPCGVIGTTVDCTINASATSGGSYAPVTGGAIAQQTVAASIPTIDFAIPAGKPWLQIVLVTVGATTAACAQLYGHGPEATNQP